MSSVREAAAALVADFASNDAAAYFAHFAPEATFIFHTTETRLADRAAYESLWAQWVEEGFRVHSCHSSGALVQKYGDVAIFTHDVDTVVSLGGAPESLRERETIVFTRSNGGWIAVHEHLSARP